MGRFYETAQRNFVDDFIYQPPWEMAMLALTKQNEDVQTSLDTMEVMRNLPVDYAKGIDDERANRVRTEWEDRINSVAGKLQKNLLDPSNKAELAQLRRDLTKDMTSGNIYKIQQNAENIRQFKEKLDKLKNPADKAIALRQLEAYKKNNPEGAYGSLFEGEDPFDTRNLWEEYTKSDSFKALAPDIKASDIQQENGKWIVRQGNNVEELSKSKIGQNFRTWMANNTDIKPYASYRQKWNNEQWLDENGNLREDDDSMYGKMLNDGVSSLVYSKTSTQRGIESNPYTVMQMQQAFQEKQAREQRAYEENIRNVEIQAQMTSPETMVTTSKLLKISADIQEKLKQSSLAKMSKVSKLTPEQIYEKISKNEKLYREKYKNVYKDYLSIKQKIDNNRIASEQIIVSQFGETEANKMFKKVNEKLYYNTKFSVTLPNGNASGKKYDLSDINRGDFKLDGIEVAKGSARFAPDVTFVPGSTMNRSVVVKAINFEDKHGVEHTSFTYIPFSNFTGVED